MVMELNKSQLMTMGMQVGKELTNNNPVGSVESGIGQFLGNLPTSIANVNNIVTNLKEMQKAKLADAKANAPQPQMPPQMQQPQLTADGIPNFAEQPQVVQLKENQPNFNEEKLREIINFELNGLLAMGENQRPMLEGMTGMQLIGLLELQKDTIVDSFVKRLMTQ